jgi:DNA-binding response OmpR family regulator
VSGDRPYVLVAEPRKQLREALKETLGETFFVLAAQTADGAVVGFEHHSPPVAIVAMAQDTGNGFDLCRRLRQMDEHSRSMLVVYGAPPADLPEFVEETIQQQYGVDRYVPKGATMRSLDDLAKERLRGGWKVAAAPGVQKKAAVDPAKANPFTADGVVSAKNVDEDAGFGLKSLRKLFKRR